MGRSQWGFKPFPMNVTNVNGINYNLTPRGIIESLHLLDVDYNEVSAYGHFGKKGLPWEQ